jgi:hypothetical protein
MPRGQYVLLVHHTQVEEHWDLLLEAGQGLLTWRLEQNPMTLMKVDHSPQVIPARRLADHRPVYLTYQGPISDGRGRVTRLDEGTYIWRAEKPNTWIFALQGKNLQGGFYLRKRSQSNGREGGSAWEFGCEPA